MYEHFEKRIDLILHLQLSLLLIAPSLPLVMSSGVCCYHPGFLVKLVVLQSSQSQRLNARASCKLCLNSTLFV